MKYCDHWSKKQIEAVTSPLDAALISITCPHTEPAILQTPWADLLRIEFDDVTTQLWGVTTQLWDITTEGAKEGCYIVPDETHAKQLGDFIRANWDRTIIVHCVAGVSRSAAVCQVLKELGWEYRGWGTHKANPTVYKLLREYLA